MPATSRVGPENALSGHLWPFTHDRQPSTGAKMKDNEKSRTGYPPEPNIGQTEMTEELTQDSPKRGYVQRLPTKPLSVQQRWGRAAQEGSEAGNKLTNSQALAQFRQNSGYVVTAIHLLPKPGSGTIRRAKKPS